MPEIIVANFCPSYEPETGKTQRFPVNEDHTVDVDLVTKFLEVTGSYPAAMPTEIDPFNPGFGTIATSQRMGSEFLDGFEAMTGFLDEESCTPGPLTTPGLINFEVLHLAFRTAALFRTSWAEIPACVQYEPSEVS